MTARLKQSKLHVLTFLKKVGRSLLSEETRNDIEKKGRNLFTVNFLTASNSFRVDNFIGIKSKKKPYHGEMEQETA